MTALTLQTFLLLGVAYLAGCMCACILRRSLHAARSRETGAFENAAEIRAVAIEQATDRSIDPAPAAPVVHPVPTPVAPLVRPPPAPLTLPRNALPAGVASPVSDGFRRADTLEPAPQSRAALAPRPVGKPSPSPAPAPVTAPLRGPASIPVPSAPVTRATPAASPSAPGRDATRAEDAASRFRRALDGPGQAATRPASTPPAAPAALAPTKPATIAPAGIAKPSTAVPPPVVLGPQPPQPPQVRAGEPRVVLPVPEITPQPRPPQAQPQNVQSPPVVAGNARPAGNPPAAGVRSPTSANPPVVSTPPPAIKPAPAATVVTSAPVPTPPRPVVMAPAPVARPAAVTPAAPITPPSVVAPAAARPSPVEPPAKIETPVAPVAPRPGAQEGSAPPAETAALPSGAADAVAKSDDLTRIRGIDGQVEAALSLFGVTRYAQIAAWRPDDVARLSNALNFRGRIEQENWIEQAQILARGEETAFSRSLSQRERAASNQSDAPSSSNAPTTAPDVSAPARENRPAATGTSTGPGGAAGTAEGGAPRAMRPSNDTAAASAAAVAAAAATRASQPTTSTSVSSAQALGLSRPPTPVATPAIQTPASSPDVSERAAFSRAESAAPAASPGRPSAIIVPQSTATPTPQADDAARPDVEQDGRKSPDLTGLRSVRSDVFRSSQDQPATPFVSAGGQSAPGQFLVVDDLKRIRGIGVLIEKKLNSMGINGYEQIANWSSADIDRVSEVLDFKGRIERENWVEQARILAVGGQTEFSRRIDRNE